PVCFVKRVLACFSSSNRNLTSQRFFRYQHCISDERSKNHISVLSDKIQF
ncbi:hypothetical protein X975_00873, partial [Stegodyphus mimosarum]